MKFYSKESDSKMGCCGNNRPTDEGVEMTGQKSGGNNNGKGVVT